MNAFPLVLAHFTGLPHHVEETQSLIALWPLFVAAAQVIWFLFRRWLRRAIPALLLVVVAPLLSAPAAAPKELRNERNVVLGYVTILPDGRHELRDASRRLLGTFNPKTNETRDASNKLVGRGNLLTLLLRN